MKKQLEQHYQNSSSKTNIIGSIYFKSNEIEQCYTFFIIWIKCRNRPRY